MPALIVFFLISPYLILLYHFPEVKLNDFSEVISVFEFTFIQSILSTILSVFLGFFVGLSLSAYSGKKKYKWFELICLAPSLLPVIFIVFASLNIFGLLSIPLNGLFGIVIINTLINVGLFGALFSRILVNKMSLPNLLAMAQGIPKIKYIFKVLIPITFKDIVFLASSIFLFCFTSFSIPLIIGGIKSTTVELLIYEKLIVSNSMVEAISIALIQFTFLLVIMILLNKLKLIEKSKECQWVPYIYQKFALLLPVLVCVFILIGMFVNINNQFLELISREYFFKQVLLSFSVALMVGYLVFVFFQFIFSLHPNLCLEFFLISYSSPSTVLVCLSFVLILSVFVNFLWVGIFLVYLIIYTPYLYKIFVQNIMSDLLASQKLALVMGGNYWMRLKVISFPITFKLCLFLSFISAAWVLGDYAVTSFFLSSDITLAMLVKSSMRSYKMNEASNLVIILLFLEIIIYFIYKGILSVSSRKH